MNNLKKLLAALLVLALSLGLCACGGKAEAPAETEAPVVQTEAPVQETEAPAEEASEGGYTITVVDENGKPIAGAMVQMCKDTCYPGVTNEEGVVTFDLAEDDYKVSFLMLPAGYVYADETEEFHFENGSKSLTITLMTEKAE